MKEPIFPVGTTVWRPCAGRKGRKPFGHVGRMETVTGQQDGQNIWKGREWIERNKAEQEFPDIIITSEADLCPDCQTPDK